jgi:hypothetical protein
MLTTQVLFELARIGWVPHDPTSARIWRVALIIQRDEARTWRNKIWVPLVKDISNLPVRTVCKDSSITSYCFEGIYGQVTRKRNPNQTDCIQEPAHE